MRNITFFFPYPHISGIPVLFSNLTNYLLETYKSVVNIIDYKDGALINSCDEHPRLNFIEFKDFEKCIIDFETHLVLQGGLPNKLRQELVITNKVKIFMWAAYEFNFVPYMSRIRVISNLQRSNLLLHNLFRLLNYKNYRVLSEWVIKMAERGSISFMNKPIFETTVKYLFIKNEIHSVKYLPNFGLGNIEYSKRRIVQKSNEVKKSINLCWLGRIADFKVHILNYSLVELSKLARIKNSSIIFHIIGSGEFEDKLMLKCQHEFFKIIKVGRLEKDQVDKYLFKNIHGIFAMGTSALDGARLGLPTILLDQSYSKVNEGYIFKYLFNAESFDLGHPITNLDFKKGNDSLEKIIEGFKEEYKNLSDKTIKYFNNNHSINIICNKFLNKIDGPEYFQYHEIDKRLLKLGLLRRLYLLYLEKVKKTYY